MRSRIRALRAACARQPSSQLEAAISESEHRIENCLVDTVSRSSLEPDEIHTVVGADGSAQIPLFVGMVERLLGREKIVLVEVFSSATPALLCTLITRAELSHLVISTMGSAGRSAAVRTEVAPDVRYDLTPPHSVV